MAREFLVVAMLAAMAWVSGALGAEAETLSLDQAVRRALKVHPGLQRLAFLRRSLEASEDVAASAFYPQIALEGIGKQGPPSAPALGLLGLPNSTLTNNFGGGVVVSQVLTDSGGRYHRSLSRGLQTRAALEDEQARRAQVSLQTHRAYYDVLLQEKLVALAGKDLGARELTIRLAQGQFDAGLSSRVDVELARTGAAESRVRLLEAENALARARAELGILIGEPELEKELVEPVVVAGEASGLSL